MLYLHLFIFYFTQHLEYNVFVRWFCSSTNKKDHICFYISYMSFAILYIKIMRFEDMPNFGNICSCFILYIKVLVLTTQKIFILLVLSLTCYQLIKQKLDIAQFSHTLLNSNMFLSKFKVIGNVEWGGIFACKYMSFDALI